MAIQETYSPSPIPVLRRCLGGSFSSEKELSASLPTVYTRPENSAARMPASCADHSAVRWQERKREKNLIN